MKMKNYLTEWKKFLKESVESAEAEVQSAKTELEAVSKYADMLKKNAQTKLGQAEAQVQAEKAKEQQEKSLERMQQASEPATTGTTSTSGTKMEENVAGERDEGTTGPQPVSVYDEELSLEEEEEVCGDHEGVDEAGNSCKVTLEYEDMEEEKTCNECRDCRMCGLLTEAKYKGRTVPLGKPMRGDVKKFKVYVRDPSTGNIKKVNFGDKKMRIKKSNPKRRKSFRARHNCANPGPRTMARYWACRSW